MIESQWFAMQATAATVFIAIALFIITAIFSFITMQRNNFAKNIVALELLRLLLVAMVGITFNQPEWMQKYLPKEEPVLAVLWDDSDSMKTKDVKNPKFPNEEPVTRSQWVEDHRKSDAIWDSTTIGDAIKIVKEPFNSNLKEPGKGSDLNAALNRALEQYPNLRGVVMFSDGDWNIGNSPMEAAKKYSRKGIPIFTVGVGGSVSLPDVSVVSLNADVKGQVNKPMRIPFTIESTLGKKTTVMATFETTAGDSITKSIDIPENGAVSDVIVWRPKRIGDYTVTLSIPTDADEITKKNNSLSVPIKIQNKPYKILLVESYPRWEYRYFRNALERDPGVEVNCVLFHPDLEGVGGGKGYLEKFPTTLRELKEYDVVFLGDVGVQAGQLTLEDCKNIKGMVKDQKSGLILMPGFRGNQFSLQQTELNELIPVVYDETQPRGRGSQIPAKFELTESGRKSLLTKLADTPEANASVWRSLPGFQWCAPVIRAKAGSQVLAVHGTDRSSDGVRIPLLVTKTYGLGKILFMGTDGAWRWREGVEDKYHYRFWGQVARWMAYQRQMADGDGIKLSYNPSRPKVGSTITLDANVEGIGGEPLQKGNVNLQIIAPSGATKKIKLNPPSDDQQWGLFTGQFIPKEHGPHQAIVTCRETGATLETIIDVLETEIEKLGKPARFSILRDISRNTQGKMVMTSQINDLFAAIDRIPDPKPRVKPIRLWANPFWAGLIILLLGVFWMGRKFAGKI